MTALLSCHNGITPVTEGSKRYDLSQTGRVLLDRKVLWNESWSMLTRMVHDACLAKQSLDENEDSRGEVSLRGTYVHLPRQSRRLTSTGRTHEDDLISDTR